MSGVLGRPTLKRQDIIIPTRADHQIGFRWWRSADGGQTREPVDLTGYTGVAEMRGADGTVWAEIPVTIATHPEDPLVIFATSPDDFSAPEWGARRSGEYSIFMTDPDGAVTQLATGYLYLSR